MDYYYYDLVRQLTAQIQSYIVTDQGYSCDY